MGFGFNLIGFPLLLLATCGLIIYAGAKKTRKPLLVVIVLWGLTIALFVVSAVGNYYSTPIRLTKADIIGDYRIDTNFYNGSNAQWQYNRFRFTITPDDSLYFFITNKDTLVTTYKSQIVYSTGPPDLWKLENEAPHVLKHPPTLYRGYNQFYYVFQSDQYGNMFFRKIKK